MKLNEHTRAYIYRVLIAAGALAAGYGLIADNQLSLIAGLAAAVLNIMPAANTSTKE